MENKYTVYNRKYRSEKVEEKVLENINLELKHSA